MPNKRFGLIVASFILWGLGVGLFGTSLPVAASTAVPVPVPNPGYGWGYNYSGQVGNGEDYTDTPTPATVQMPAGVSSFTAIAAGEQFSLGQGNDGKLYAWGYNGWGQLGVGPEYIYNPLPIPVKMPAGVSSFTAFAAGNYHSLGLGSDGNLYSWGYNTAGQLGNGSRDHSFVPTPVKMPTGVSTFTAIAAGNAFSLGLGNDGKLYAWGSNTWGQLGNGTNTSSSVPVAVQMPAGVSSFTAIGAGWVHSLGLGNDGKLYAWGYNKFGQLGNGTDTHSNIPQAVLMPAGVSTFTALVGGEEHSLALGSDGKLYAWGYNDAGQLGTDSYNSSFIPIATKMPAGVSSFTVVDAGRFYSLGLGNDGKLYAWGYNGNGQLGNGAATPGVPTLTPRPVLLPAGVGVFAAGTYHALATAPLRTVTNITSTPNPVQVGQAVTFSVSILPAAATGTVSFTFGSGDSSTSVSVPLGNGVASYMTTTLPLGQTLVTATYSGDPNYASSVSKSYSQLVVPNCSSAVVTNLSDEGQAKTCGSLSYALATTDSGTINFALTGGSNTITFSGSLIPILKPGVTLDGGVNGLVLNGNGVAGDGLRLGGNNTVANLTVRNFGGRELLTTNSSTANQLFKVKVQQ